MSWSPVEGVLSIANSSLLFNSFSRKTCWHGGRNPLLARAIVLTATIMVKAILLRPFPNCLAKKWMIAPQPYLHCLPLRKLMPGTTDDAGSGNGYNVSASPARAMGAREAARAKKRRGRACDKYLRRPPPPLHLEATSSFQIFAPLLGGLRAMYVSNACHRPGPDAPVDSLMAPPVWSAVGIFHC
jgi:hypothetical protein